MRLNHSLVVFSRTDRKHCQNQPTRSSNATQKNVSLSEQKELQEKHWSSENELDQSALNARRHQTLKKRAQYVRCIRPLKAGLRSDGSLNYTNKGNSLELVGLEFECRKCLPCLLNQAREKAIRCIHEARMHENSIFLTLTYREEDLKSPYLNYLDFELFMKSLREERTRNLVTKEAIHAARVPFMVTGEYGEKTRRPHWHVLLFNYSPANSRHLRSTPRGDRIYTSEQITDLWPHGMHEYGAVTIESAGYTARYGAKALGEKDPLFKPLHNTSKKYVLGKSWIEKYYQHAFDNGFVVLPDGTQGKIPRYYVEWAKKNQPEAWLRYVTQVRPKLIQSATDRGRKEELEYLSEFMSRTSGDNFRVPLTKSKVKETILKSKFKQLQEKLKL